MSTFEETMREAQVIASDPKQWSPDDIARLMKQAIRANAGTPAELRASIARIEEVATDKEVARASTDALRQVLAEWEAEG